ncbi:hypothetical protein ACFEO8_002929 [Salmonella enterica]
MGSNIIELAKLGHERAAELKASCGAVDVRSLAQLISDLASQLEVQYVRAEESQREFRAADATINNLELKLTDMAVQLANAESKCREMAAESVGLKKTLTTIANSEEFHGDTVVCDFDTLVTAAWSALSETPTTDAFLDEVRAQGVEMAVDVVKRCYDNICAGGLQESREYEESIVQPHLDGIDDELNEIIAQLRKGAAL